MSRFLSAIFPLLVSFSAYAMDAKDPPIPTETNVVGIVIFAILFFGGCIGFFVYLFWSDRKKPNDKTPGA